MLQGLYRSRVAGADFAPYAIAAFTAVDGQAVPATDPTKPIMGVADSLPVPAGREVDVQMTETTEVVAGAVIAPGDRLTTDANGHAVPAAKVAGSTVHVFAVAQVSALQGDVFEALLAFSTIDG